jgi:hypothetical protein
METLTSQVASLEQLKLPERIKQTAALLTASTQGTPGFCRMNPRRATT